MDDGADRQELQELWRSIRIDALRRGADDHTADDVVQETWLRALQKPPEDRGRFRGWLHVVARRYLRELRGAESYRLRRERWVARTEAAPPASAEDTPLVRYVEELPEPYRGVIRLRFFEDRDVDEIAVLLGRPPETVRSQLKRGLERLRVRLGARPRSRIERLIGLGWIRDFFSGQRLGEGRAVPRRLGLSILGIAVVVLGWTLWSMSSREAAVGRLGSVAAAFEVVHRDGLALTPLPPEPRESIETSEAVAVRPEPSGTFLAGIVRDPAGSPVPGARVWAVAAGSSAATHSVLADESGHYRIVVGPHDMVWASFDDWCDSLRCYVACVEEDDLDLFLAPTRGTLEVIVQDHDGAPVADALVQFDPELQIEQRISARRTLEFSVPSPPVRTDEHGRARLAIPRREFVTLVVVPPTLPAWTEELAVTDGSRTHTVTLLEPSPLRGTLVDDAGLPAWNARVVALQLGGLVQREIHTRPDGTFELEGLRPGDFVVRALEDPASGTRSARRAGVLAEGVPVELDLTLSSGTTVQGQILEHGVPSAGAVVSLQSIRPHPAEGGLDRKASTDAAGRFVFEGCDLRVGYVLRARAPGSDRTTVEELVLRPDEELVYEVGEDPADLAPMVVEFSGPRPSRVELRRAAPSNSILLEPESGGTRFRSEPLPAGEYHVVAWFSDLGTWHPRGGFEHVPASPSVHPFERPEPTTLEVELDLPDEVRREDVEVQVDTLGFNYFGIGSFGKPVAYRNLSWNAERRTYSIEVLPGISKLYVRGGGVAPIREVVKVADGGMNLVHLHATIGIRVRFVFRSRALMPTESVQITALYATGELKRTYAPSLLHEIEGGFEVVTYLPLSTTEIHAVTEQQVPYFLTAYKDVLGTTVLTGTRTVTTEELCPGEGMPRLEFKLEEVPK